MWEQKRELIKSPTINSDGVGNPSTPRNQPSHRNVLQRKKQATSVRNRLPPSAPTPTGGSTEVQRVGGEERRRN